MNNLTIKILSLLSKRFKAIIEEKKHIRKEIRLLKKDMSNEQKLLDAKVVFDKIEVLPEFKTANTILIYWSTPDELPTQDIIRKWCDTKQMILPAIEEDSLVLKQFTLNGKLIQKKLGIWEPDLTEIFDDKVDLIIVPGIAFDLKKNRLGRGKGYYDRFFEKYKPFKIGVGFDFQLLDSIPVAKHDIKMDLIITPSKTIK